VPLLAGLASVARRLPESRIKVRAGRVIATGLTAAGATPAVESTLSDGSRMLLDTRSRTEAGPLWNGSYEPEYVALLVALTERFGGRFLDVGANVGLIAVPVGRRLGPAGRLTCVEPIPDNVDRLRSNLLANGLSDAVVLQTALGGADGTVGIVRESRGRGVSGNAIIEGGPLPPAYAARFEVPIRPLDEVVAERGIEPPDVVKLDVEGSEVGVLVGGRQTFASSRPVILGEFNSTLMPNFGTTFLDAFAALPEDYAAFGFVTATVVEERAPEPGLGDVLLVPREKVDRLPVTVRGRLA
jgi:FkbM family methyltransferase